MNAPVGREDKVRFKFFPGSELGPPGLLGGVVDLDRPQHLVANVAAAEQVLQG